MKKILSLLLILPSIVFAQQYNSTNVHYYLPEGYSITDIGKTQDPYNTLSLVNIRVIITNPYDAYSGEFGNFNTPSVSSYINQLNNTIKLLQENYRYIRDNKLSNEKISVYSYDDRKIGVSSDYKKLILWRDGHEEKRQTFYEIDINKVLPKTSDYDFLK